MSATLDALKLLGPVFDSAIVSAKTAEIDRELSAARERLDSIGAEAAEARRALGAAERAPQTLDAAGKIDFGDRRRHVAEVNLAIAGRRFADLERDIASLERKRSSVSTEPDDPTADADADADENLDVPVHSRRPGTPQYVSA
jgi:hypothetical protein